MKDNSQMIGKKVEYQVGNQTFQGVIRDRVTISHRDTGQPFDLYLIMTDDRHIYRISPTCVTKILE